MKNWRKYRNFKKYEDADGLVAYIITVDGEDVEVSEAIYKAYKKGAYKMEYMERGLKRDRVKKDANGIAVMDAGGQIARMPELETSFDKLIDEDWEFPSPAPSPEDDYILSEHSESEELRRCLSLLTDDEQDLIHALFFEGMADQAYAETLGVTRQAVNKRKLRVLKKIKKFWQ